MNIVEAYQHRALRRDSSSLRSSESQLGSGPRLLLQLAPAHETFFQQLLDLLRARTIRLDLFRARSVISGIGHFRGQVRLLAFERLDLRGQRLEFAFFLERKFHALRA